MGLRMMSMGQRARELPTGRRNVLRCRLYKCAVESRKSVPERA